MNYSDLEYSDTELAEFAFETDHLAIRGNRDYCELLKYIVQLEAQKVQTLKDIEELAFSKSKALKDPIKFVQDFKSGNINFPPRQTVANIPDIEWEKYDIEVTIGNDIKPSKEELESSLKVRGRMFTDNKPETFNQLWSCEEQKRLEELLEIYPEEAIESKRYKKIADALGTRTTVQVMSRIQKYFTKLAKAGLPIPGRAPKGVHKDRYKDKYSFYKKSTFFPQLHVPVRMEDPHENNDSLEDMSSSETSNGNKNMLELLKAAKEQRQLDEASPVYQTNTMCVGCQKSGFLGPRWTDNAGTDFCTDCIVKLLPSEKLIPVR